MAAWTTNDEAVSRKLRKADRAYEKARKSASHLSLAEKIAAYSNAVHARNLAYEAAIEHCEAERP